MHVAFLAPSLSRAGGGVFEVEKALALNLAKLPETHIDVFGLEDDYFANDAGSWRPLQPKAHRIVGPHAFGYSPLLAKDFLASNADVAHLHSLWMYTTPLVRRWARLHRKPFVTTLHGMLDPWALRNSRLKKSLAALLYERRSLEAAACIHVTCESELEAARNFGLKGPVCIIPNGVSMPESDTVELPRSDHPVKALRRSGERVLLYLGRLHPKKGLLNLIDALARVGQSADGWTLAIVGWDQLGHEAELRARCRTLGLEGRVHFLGPQFGDDKALALRHADAFILPSFSEGLPIAVLEAWSYGKPVLMTAACNLDIGFETGAAVRIDTDPEKMAAALSAFFAMGDRERNEMGERGIRLVQTTFLWPDIANRMRQVYEWLISGGQAPAFVVRD